MEMFSACWPVFSYKTPNRQAERGKKKFENPSINYPKERTGTFNQAMMDFGARLAFRKTLTVRLPRTKFPCFHFNKGAWLRTSVKVNKPKVKERDIHYYVIKLRREMGLE